MAGSPLYCTFQGRDSAVSPSSVILFLKVRAGGILGALQSDWLPKQAETYDLARSSRKSSPVCCSTARREAISHILKTRLECRAQFLY